MFLFGDAQWVEFSQERGALELELFPRLDGEPWRIDFRDTFKALDGVKRKLMGG